MPPASGSEWLTFLIISLKELRKSNYTDKRSLVVGLDVAGAKNITICSKIVCGLTWVGDLLRLPFTTVTPSWSTTVYDCYLEFGLIAIHHCLISE
jgi:hypothetical protein